MTELALQNATLDQVIDIERLTAWLDHAVPQLGDAPLQATLLRGGTSNTIIQIDRGGKPAILRRPPANPPPASERAMLREATVLEALNQTDVPHPYFHAVCTDPAIIGATFYIMDKVEGWAAQVSDSGCVYPPPFDQKALKYQVYSALADGLISLSRVDYRQIGLGAYGNPEGFLARQVERWRSQLASYPQAYPGYAGRTIPGIDYVVDWLSANIPPMSPAGLIHGDYGAANVLFGHHPPASIAAIIDWELSTIGDPLLDLGWMTYSLRDRQEPGIVPPSAYFDSADFPTRQDIIEYYAEKTGRNIDCIEYYLVLAQYKLACIVEYKVALASTGRENAAMGKLFGPMTINLIAEAEKIARRAR